MIIEVNTKVLDKVGQINLNQLIFLNLVLDKNQKPHQDVRKIVSLISDEEILDLINRNLVDRIDTDSATTYQPSDQLKTLMGEDRNYFDLFYDMYPVYVMRPDGTKNYLRANVNKCRHLFESYTGKSSAMSEHLIDCLKFEIEKKTRTGKISYMKTMWRWLVDHQWEETEEEMRDTATVNNAYGTDIL